MNAKYRSLDISFLIHKLFDWRFCQFIAVESYRFLVLQLYTKKLPLNPDVDLQAIAASCNGYVGADLEALCREAAMSAMDRSRDENKDDGMWCITMQDWTKARGVVGPSITRGVTVEIPKVSWDDIGGLNDLKVSLFNFRYLLDSSFFYVDFLDS